MKINVYGFLRWIFACWFLVPLLVLLNAKIVSAQNSNITGKVYDVDTGESLPGVTVRVKDSDIGTSTDIDGNFSIELKERDQTLIFSFIGYLSQEVQVGNKSSLSIPLSQDIKGLEEVVVVGFSTQKKVNLTGAVSSISDKNISVRPVGQASAALQGLAPGVTVTQRSGKPGGDGGTIRIRGVGTLSSANPLVIIDGIEGDINSLDPNMIESISVLKDAASASIYGSRAANGVVLVTTKRAKGESLVVNYRGYVGWQQPTNLPNMVNAIDHMRLTNVAYVNTGRDPLYSEELINDYIEDGGRNIDLYPNTDWQKEVLTGSGIMNSHFISVNGGAEKIKFLTSFGYLDQKGIINNSGFKRLSFRNNTDVTFSKRFGMKVDLQLLAKVTEEPGRSTSSVFHWMNRIPANQPGINSNGTWGEGWNGANPIAFSNDGGLRKNSSLPRIQLNTSFDYNPIDDLKLSVAVAPRFAEYSNDEFYGAIDTFHPDGNLANRSPALSTLTREYSRSFYNNLRATAVFDKVINEDHNLKVLLGASREDYYNEFTSAFRDNFILPDYPVLNTGSAANQQNSGSASEWSLQSFFGRVNYDINQKYLFEINGRYDGSSRFSSGNKYGFFPSLSAGWRVSEEGFMESLSDFLTEFKVRGSWGRLGNQDIGNYPFTSSIAIGSYTFNKEIVNIGALNTMANSQISWETTEMIDIGLDISLWSNLSITADYYSRETRDILYDLDIPLTIGLGRPYQNAGVVSNKGWEAGLTYKGAVNDFMFDVGFNISDVVNKVIDLKGVNRSGLTVSREGYPINSIYGFESLGYFQSEDEIAEHATQFGNVKPGDIKYKDQNGDGIINDDDNVVIGSTIPRLTYGLTLNGSFKGFDLNVFIQGVGRADGYLYQQGIMPFFNGGTVQEQHKDYWTPDNRDAAFPRLQISEANNEKNSSFWLKNAAYARLKNLQIGYTIPSTISSRFGIDNFRLYINGQNLLTLDKFWDGYDVEAPVGRGDTYPQVKVYSIGLDVKF
ncbi:TonB-dependent receptor [Echinicola sediminis]